MPGRKAKPPRLWFREDEGCWVILDQAGGKRRQIRTGCGRDDTDGAAQALEKYIGSRHSPTIGATDARLLSIADVLTFYETSKRPTSQDPRKLADHELLLIRLLDLNTFFGAKKVSELKAQLCRDFVDWSTGTPNENNKPVGIPPRDGTVSDQTARRRLEDLRAAINAYHAEHTLSVVPKITMPAKAEGRQRWLTRNEAARLFGAAMGYVWDVTRGCWKRKLEGSLFRRERWIINRRRPAARFILVGLYSARREETIRRTQWLPTTTHPWMNLSAMIYQGRGSGEQPPRSGDRLRKSPIDSGHTWCVGASSMRVVLPNCAPQASWRPARKFVSSSTACMMDALSRERSAPLGRASLRMLASVRTWCGTRSATPPQRGKCRPAPICGKLPDGSA